MVANSPKEWRTIVGTLGVVITVMTLMALFTLKWHEIVDLFRRWFCWGSRKPSAVLSRNIQRAIKELQYVTTRRPTRNLRTEVQAPECRICLGFLFPEDEQAEAEAAGNVDLESGQGADNNASKRKKKQGLDIPLMINRCSHTFHAQCLGQWYLEKKYNCPVCRTQLYQEMDEMVARGDIELPRVPPTVLLNLSFW
ncbi:hypothetical protein GGR52DRAFT_182115 [Hypoxylon sp. FL1284]|nr:hypothetical protein GGR52DRAFT_182115 [Hypoxylon sp. FL1284]